MALSPVCCFTCFFSDENCRIIITVAGELPCVFRQLALLAATDADNIETPVESLQSPFLVVLSNSLYDCLVSQFMITLASLFSVISTFPEFQLMFCTNKTFLQTYANLASHDSNLASHDSRTTAKSIIVQHPPYSESGVYSSPPTYTDVNFSNNGPSRFFVNMSLSFSLPDIHFTCNTLASFISLSKSFIFFCTVR